MRKQTSQDVAEAKQHCIEIGELVGVYRWHKWPIPAELSSDWEAVLDGTYLRGLGLSDNHVDDIAEAALHARHDAFYNHETSRCAEHATWRYEEEEIDLDLPFVG